MMNFLRKMCVCSAVQDVLDQPELFGEYYCQHLIRRRIMMNMCVICAYLDLAECAFALNSSYMRMMMKMRKIIALRLFRNVLLFRILIDMRIVLFDFHPSIHAVCSWFKTQFNTD